MHTVVFNHFDQDFFDERILSKLEGLGFNEIRSWSICAEENETRPSNEISLSDVIIVFQDMTTKSQRDAIKELTKKLLKPTVFVSSKNSNWDKEVAKKIPSVKKGPIDNSSQSVSVKSESSMTPETPILESMAESKLEEIEPASELKEMLELYESENGKLVRKLADSEKFASNLKAERDSFSKAVEDLTKELGEVTDSRNYVNNLRSEITAIMALSKDGVLSDSEALRQLFTIAEDLNASKL